MYFTRYDEIIVNYLAKEIFDVNVLSLSVQKCASLAPDFSYEFSHNKRMPEKVTKGIRKSTPSILLENFISFTII